MVRTIDEEPARDVRRMRISTGHDPLHVQCGKIYSGLILCDAKHVIRMLLGYPLHF